MNRVLSVLLALLAISSTAIPGVFIVYLCKGESLMSGSGRTDGPQSVSGT